MAYTTIEVSTDGPRARIVLNRPEKLNPLGTTTLLELVDAAGALDAMPAVKVVVIAGNGRAFERGGGPGGVRIAAFFDRQRQGGRWGFRQRQ